MLPIVIADSAYFWPPADLGFAVGRILRIFYSSEKRRSWRRAQMYFRVEHFLNENFIIFYPAPSRVVGVKFDRKKNVTFCDSKLPLGAHVPCLAVKCVFLLCKRKMKLFFQ